MPVIELSAEQVAQLVEQLSPEERLKVLLRLADTARTRMATHRVEAESRLRRLAAERGLDWDTLTEEQRVEFVDELLHE